MAPCVAMLLSNAFRPDPRVHKEARSLAHAGYRVTVICWDRQGEYPEQEEIDGFTVRRIRVASGYGVGSRQLLYLPRFWWGAWQELRRLRPAIVHCHDLDTTVPGYAYALAHHVPWIFDAHEAYPEATMDLRVGRGVYKALLLLERQMARRATQVITVGNLIAQRFREMGGRVAVVGNYQPLPEAQPRVPVTREELGLGEQLLVAYIGGFTRARAILPLIEASALVQGVAVLLLGDGPQRPAVEAALPHYPQVRYLGQVPQEEVPGYTALADVAYYGLAAADANNRYSSPNALFNALACGKPVLTTDVGEIAHIVREERCGIVVEEATPALLAGAIRELQDETRRRALGENARRAAVRKYNWATAERTLLQVYAKLAGEGKAPIVPAPELRG